MQESLKTEIVKVCKVHGPLTIEGVIYADKNLKYFACKYCNNIRSKIWKKKNKDKANLTYKNFIEKNPGYLKKYNDDYRKNNLEKLKICRSKSYFKGKEILSDSYITECIKRRSNIKTSDIPIELIELKRESILLKREIASQLGQINENK